MYAHFVRPGVHPRQIDHEISNKTGTMAALSLLPDFGPPISDLVLLLLDQSQDAVRRGRRVRFVVTGDGELPRLHAHVVGYNAGGCNTAAAVLDIDLGSRRVDISVEHLVVASLLHLQLIGVGLRLHDCDAVVSARCWG